jgi:TonB family protein
MGMGAGAGNNGSSEEGSQLAGIPSGVRSLEQLRQMPGNPRPQYDRQERLLRHQGSVAFLAYINKQGYVSKFRMLKSTGYKNLDGKTLAALKKWRFYPGQEGWVELPFQWDLKGGVQEAGGRLRVSRN